MEELLQHHLDILQEITSFAESHALNDNDELTPAQFTADQFLRRCITLSKDFTMIMRLGHEPNAAILLRAITERALILKYIRHHDQFLAFQKYSFAREYENLQRVTSDPNIEAGSRQMCEQRKQEIRARMGGEPNKPSTYWQKPTIKRAMANAIKAHTVTNLFFVTAYDFPSSSIHVRHNDAEPTGVMPESTAILAAVTMGALISSSLQIADNQITSTQFDLLFDDLLPE